MVAEVPRLMIPWHSMGRTQMARRVVSRKPLLYQDSIFLLISSCLAPFLWTVSITLVSSDIRLPSERIQVLQ